MSKITIDLMEFSLGTHVRKIKLGLKNQDFYLLLEHLMNLYVTDQLSEDFRHFQTPSNFFPHLKTYIL